MSTKIFSDTESEASFETGGCFGKKQRVIRHLE